MGQGKAKSARMAPPAPGRPTVRSSRAPEEHDYPAAAAYLSLLADPATVPATVTAPDENAPIPARLVPLGTPA